MVKNNLKSLIVILGIIGALMIGIIYYHYQYLRKEIEKVEGDTSIFKSFIANSMIMKICELNKKDYKEYKKKLKEKNVYSDLLTDTKVRKIKKWLVSLSPRIYYKIMQ